MDENPSLFCFRHSQSTSRNIAQVNQTSIPHSTELDWQDGQPFSPRYQDIFFSRQSGLEETRHVFLASNKLQERWCALSSDNTFVVGETGFGTGLNFLATWQLWDRVAATGRLHYFSFELHPLSRHALEQALMLWPELAHWREQLLAQYQTPTPGWHRFLFQNEKVTLTLVVGDIGDCLPRFVGKAHAWFLDGFSPAKNPEMWTAAVLSQIAKHSHDGATFATYTSAGAVRRNLQSLGFVVTKAKGFGRKKEMLSGVLPHTRAPMLSHHEKEVIIIGGGVAGCSTAHGLARRGWRITILERGPTLASGASGISRGVLHLRLPLRLTASHYIGLLGYQFTARLLQTVRMFGTEDWHPCGTLQLDHASRRPVQSDQLTELGIPDSLAHRLTREAAAAQAGVPVESSGIYFPQGGWMDASALCARLTAHDAISRRLDTHVSGIAWSREQNHWMVTTSDGAMLHAKVVVIANAHDALSLPITSRLPLHSVGGQISFLRPTAHSAVLKTILCGEGVITPSHQGWHAVGATYNHARHDLSISEHEHAANVAMLRRLSPTLWKDGVDTSLPVNAWVGLRCTSPDRTPLAGEFDADNAPGLYVNLAHGSKGLCTAPLLGEAIASEVSQTPLPLPAELLSACSPRRFYQH